MRFFSVLFFISFSCLCIAQNWALNSSVWRYNFVNLSGVGYIQINVDNDTIIDGITCKKLNKRLFQRNAFTGTTQNFDIGQEYTYEENGIIYLRHQGSFDTLYNFNALPGESWNVPGTSPVASVCNATSRVVVIDTSSLNVNGNKLKQLIVDYEYKSSGNFKRRDTIVERMGTLAQYLVPWDVCLSTVDANEGGNFRCYNDSEIGEYKHNFFSNCNVLVSAEEKLLAMLKVYPNPVTDRLHLGYSESATISKVSLRNLHGSVIKEFLFLPEIIDIKELSQGIYLLEVFSNDGGAYRTKIMKQ